MRAVAERADVAVGTLYRYFPSKVHLLVSALGREFARIEGRGKIPPGHSPLERMHLILSLITKAMQRDPLLTEAMTRASCSPMHRPPRRSTRWASSWTGSSPRR